MATGFLHGIEVVEAQEGIRPVRGASASVIGVVGSSSLGTPVNKPIVVRSVREWTQRYGGAPKHTCGSIAAALDAVYSSVEAPVIGVNVLDKTQSGHIQDVTETHRFAGDAITVDCRHIHTSGLTVTKKGESGDVSLTLNTDYTYQSTTGAIKRKGETLVKGDTVAVAYRAAKTAGVTAAQYKAGIEALAQAETETGLKPKILIAPGAAGSAVIDALNKAAAQLRAVAVVDIGGETDSAAISTAGAASGKRLYLVHPTVQAVFRGGYDQRPASPYVAAAIALNDRERGWWVSPSNRPIRGIAGTSRHIDYSFGDSGAGSSANLLNEKKMATIIRLEGFRLWGNRTASSDPKWQFLSVVRTADAIDEAILRSHLWAVDRNIAKTYLDDVSEGVNAYLRDLVARGAILGGSCRPDPQRNTVENIADGRVYFDIEFTPAYPAERITFTSRLTQDHLTTLVND